MSDSNTMLRKLRKYALTKPSFSNHTTVNLAIRLYELVDHLKALRQKDNNFDDNSKQPSDMVVHNLISSHQITTTELADLKTAYERLQNDYSSLLLLTDNNSEVQYLIEKNREKEDIILRYQTIIKEQRSTLEHLNETICARNNQIEASYNDEAIKKEILKHTQRLNDQLIRSNKIIDDQNQTISELRTKAKDRDDEYNTIRQNKTRYDIEIKKLEEMKREKEALLRSLTDLNSLVEWYDTRNQQLQTNIDKVKADCELDKIKTVAEYASDLDQTQNRLSVITCENVELRHGLQSLRDENERLKKHIGDLQQVISGMGNSENVSTNITFDESSASEPDDNFDFDS